MEQKHEKPYLKALGTISKSDNAAFFFGLFKKAHKLARGLLNNIERPTTVAELS